MRCDRCDGTGAGYWHTHNLKRGEFKIYPAPCPYCGGTGIRHCCDGEDTDGGNDVTKGADDRPKS